jgi:SAM-dependent methyltransferase
VTEERTATVRALWDGAADIYDGAITPALADAHLALIAMLEATAGDEVLDLGCGTGRVGELVATRTSANLVAAVDLSPQMVERARRRLSPHGPLVREMDAQALRFADASFDAVVASFSLMFCPDHAAALAEARRVLRPGGRLVMGVWGLPRECETVEVGRVTAAFGEGPLPDTPNGQALGDPDHLRGLLDSAGFGRVEMRSRVTRLRYPGPDACWAAVLHVHGERIPPDRLADAEAATRRKIAEVGLPLRNRAWIVRAEA